jgi:hypothetical protein
MKKQIGILILIAMVLVLTSCIFPEDSNQVSIALTQTAAPSPSLSAQQGVVLAQDAPPLEQQIQTAIAQTQAASVSVPAVNPLVMTAIAQTQTAAGSTTLSDQQIQTAIAQMQIFPAGNALPQEPIQTAIALTQTAVSAMSAAGQQSQIDAALTQTQQAVGGSNVSSENPGDPFNGATVYSHGNLAKYTYLITLQLKGSIQGTYRAVIGGKDYKCEIQAQYPDRLYCSGPSVKGGDQTIAIFEGGGTQPKAEIKIVLPQWTPTKTPQPTDWIIYHKKEPTPTITPHHKYK